MRIRARSAFACLLCVAAAVLCLAFMNHYMPFSLSSYSIWAGVLLFLVGLVGLIKPFRFLCLRRRRHALFILMLASCLIVAALFWPTSTVRATGPHQRLDDFLPEYQAAEYHEATVRAPIERITQAAREVSLVDMPAAVFLMRLRRLAGGRIDDREPDRRPLLPRTKRPGSSSLPLDISDPRELVYGMVLRAGTSGKPAILDTPEEFLAFKAKGQVKVAFNFRCIDEGNGLVRVSTETRIMGTDPEAHRAFSRYWRVIYPGSAIIRRVLLDAIISRAQSSGSG